MTAMPTLPVSATEGGRDSRSYMGSDPVRNFRFIVTFLPRVFVNPKAEPGPISPRPSRPPGWTPQGRIGFNSVSGLAVSVEPFAIREGGYNTTYHQIPTQISYSPVTLQRGVFLGSRQHWDWLKNLFSVLQGQNAGPGALFRADVEIAVLHYPVRYANGTVAYDGGTTPESSAAFDDRVAMRFRLYNCWPSSVAFSDLNASDNALMVEQMTLVHEGLDMRWSEYNPNNTPNGPVPSAPQF